MAPKGPADGPESLIPDFIHLKGLAHPLRVRILGALREGGAGRSCLAVP
ncbi:MAG TPA: hypothetical protein VMC79_01995 [Rectinemataceae bacterium]|nr:hypothetical protein [Rectinemataceae bacterium]